jgi:hypothetical protein
MIRKILILLFLGFLIVGCMGSVDTRNLKIENQTDKIIYCIYSQTDKFPDTRIDYSDSSLEKFAIKSGLTDFLVDPPINSWDKYILDSDGQKCRILIFSKDTVLKYGWTEVKQRNLYSKKYLLDLKDFKSIDWKISYDDK